MNEKILFVDDDSNVLETYKRRLLQVFRVYTAQNPHMGLLEIQEHGPFAVVVADMKMPLMDGVAFLKRIREISPDTVRIMLTGHADIQVAMEAVNEGAVFRFLTKPCPPKVMEESLLAAIEQYSLITAEKELLEGTLKGTVELLAEVLSWVNPDAFGRTMQLRNTAMSIASRLYMKNPWEIELAATLSQLGIMAVPQDIVFKHAQCEPLTEEEMQSLKRAPSAGYELLKHIPRLEEVAKIVLYQGKHYNGTGYPEDQIQGKQLPLGARILKVADDFHVLRAQGKSRKECLEEMQGREGWYDPSILSAISREILELSLDQQPDEILPVNLSDLRVGMTLVSSVETTQGKMIIRGGTTITEPLLVRLHKYAETHTLKEPIDTMIHT